MKGKKRTKVTVLTRPKGRGKVWRIMDGWEHPDLPGYALTQRPEERKAWWVLIERESCLMVDVFPTIDAGLEWLSEHYDLIESQVAWVKEHREAA